jgi:hypothetical protein
MTPIWYGRLIGTFYGYKPGRSDELSDGSRWLQDNLADKPVYREQPTAKLRSWYWHRLSRCWWDFCDRAGVSV